MLNIRNIANNCKKDENKESSNEEENEEREIYVDTCKNKNKNDKVTSENANDSSINQDQDKIKVLDNSNVPEVRRIGASTITKIPYTKPPVDKEKVNRYYYLYFCR